MAFLEWHSEYSVGVLELDTQHKQLVAIINRLHDAMLQGAPKLAMQRILQELASYTRYHFDREEAAMRAARYTAFQEHVKQHERLEQQVAQFIERFEQGRLTVSIDLMNFLKEWLRRHILESDMAYAPSLAVMAR